MLERVRGVGGVVETGAERPYRPVASMVLALGSTSLAVLPVFMIGAMAVLVRHDLGFSLAVLGVSTAGFYGTSAVASIAGGQLAQRWGPERSLAVGLAVNAMSQLALAGLVIGPRSMFACLAVAGCTNALIQPAANDLIARQQRPGRHGVSFGLLQTAIPLSTLLAGLAVPVIGIPLGWRWAFLLGAVTALPFMLLSLQQSRGVRRDRPTVVGGDVRPARAWRLFLLAAAGGLAAAPANAAGAFYVESLVAKGIGVGQAGVWLMAGSSCGVAGRLLWGWLLDRRQGSPLRMMTLLLLVGAVGFALLGAAGTIPLLVVATGLAFAAGWGWKGLYNLAVVQRSPGWASSALGITQAGVFVGSVVGPLGFGVALGKASFAVAWSLCALSLFAATAIIWVEGRMSLPFGRKDRVGSGVAP